MLRSLVGSEMCIRDRIYVDGARTGLEETGILSSALSKKDSGHQVVRLHHECRGLHYTRSGLQSIQSIVRRRRLSLLATLHVCQIMYRPKQFCEWHAMSETEFHPSQTGADHGAVLPSPGCTRSVQTVVCPLETPSTAPRIGLCGERTLRPPRPRVDDDDTRITETPQRRRRHNGDGG